MSMVIHVPYGGSTLAAATDGTDAYRRCEDGVVHMPNVGYLPPFFNSAPALPGASWTKVDGSTMSGSKNGTVRVMLRVRVMVPINTAKAVGGVTSNTEITLHTVLTLPANAAAALLGRIPNGNNSYAAPDQIVSAAVSLAITSMVALMTNQTVDATALNGVLTTTPFFAGVAGVCPLDFDNGNYGTMWLLPPSA